MQGGHERRELKENGFDTIKEYFPQPISFTDLEYIQCTRRNLRKLEN